MANALLAVAVARGFGVPWEGICRAAAGYRSLPMRWEKKQVGGITVVNDAYNANPLSMRAALRAFAEMRTKGDKWLLLGGMLELGSRQEEEHRAVGRYAGGGAWAGIITVGPLGEMIAGGAEEAGFAGRRVFCCANNEAAARVAVERVKSGDSVLLKASRGIRLEEVLATIEETGGTCHDCDT
jgi:UDP-N-acetylmuramyl pentapeptide synthase